MDVIDLERLRQPRTRAAARARASTSAPRHRRGERFLRGPIPWDWLVQAARRGRRGSTLSVALVLWHASGLERGAARVQLRRRALTEMGVDRYSAARALKRLEAAGLVAVERHRGRLPIVTLLPTDAEARP